MTTLVKTFSFPTDAESFTFSASQADGTGQYQSGDGSPASGCLESEVTGRNKTSINTWTWTGTFEDLDAALIGQTITGISSASANHACTTYGVVVINAWHGDTTNTLPGAYLVASTDTVALSAAVSYSATAAWANSTGTDNLSLNAGSGWASTQAITIYLKSEVKFGNNGGNDVVIRQDELKFTVTYESTATPVDIDGLEDILLITEQSPLDVYNDYQTRCFGKSQASIW